MPLKLPKEVTNALEEAESFIRGFEGDEMQGGVPERILALIRCARLPWGSPRHPGDHVLSQYFRNGDAIGLVTIQDYLGCMKDGKDLRVAAFLPGNVECPPGDTPKVWPEKSEYAADKCRAAYLFEQYVTDAILRGWTKVEK